jgi:hypothetical protein
MSKVVKVVVMAAFLMLFAIAFVPSSASAGIATNIAGYGYYQNGDVALFDQINITNTNTSVEWNQSTTPDVRLCGGGKKYRLTLDKPTDVADDHILKIYAVNGTLTNTTYVVYAGLDPVNNITFSISGIANHVVISEVYVNAVNETDSEWIELYNPTNSAISIRNWTINTTTQQPDATLPATAAIPAHEFYLIGDAGWAPDNSSWPTPDYHSEEITLNNNNGWVQLNDSTGTVVDTLGWGSATTNETIAYPDNPPQAQSLQRKINDTLEQNCYGPAWDTDNNSADFFIQQEPDPQYSGSAPVAPIPELSTLILFCMGSIALAGYFLLKRR